MIRRPPRSTQSRSSAASDVYKRQLPEARDGRGADSNRLACGRYRVRGDLVPVSYTHLRAHETRHDLVCRLLLEKKKKKNNKNLNKRQLKKKKIKKIEKIKKT